jgi:hypothetical protein
MIVAAIQMVFIRRADHLPLPPGCWLAQAAQVSRAGRAARVFSVMGLQDTDKVAPAGTLRPWPKIF